MGLFGGKKPEAPQPDPSQQEAEKKDSGASMDEMLNDQGFTEFLARYEEAGKKIDLSDDNIEEIRERYDRYVHVGSTIKEVQSILAKEFSNETGVKIAGSEIEGAKDYLEDMAVNKEADFDNIIATIKRYHEISEQTDQLLEEVQQRFETLEQKQGTLNQVKEIGGFKRWTRLGLNEAQSQTIAKAKTLRLNIRHPQQSQELLNKEGVAANRQVEGATTKQLEKFDEVRMELMALLGEQTGAKQLAQKKLTEAFTDSIGESLADADKAAAMYTEYSRSEDEGELSYDYLDGVDGFDRSEFNKQLNEAAEQRVTDEIKEAVNRSHLGKSQFSRLESSVDRYVKREMLGTKTPEETKDFVFGILHEMYSRFASDPMRYQNKDIATKAFLVQRILQKYGITPKEDYAKDLMAEEAKKREEEEQRELSEEMSKESDSKFFDDEVDEEEAGEKRSGEESGAIADAEIEESKGAVGNTLSGETGTADQAPPPDDADAPGVQMTDTEIAEAEGQTPAKETPASAAPDSSARQTPEAPKAAEASPTEPEGTLTQEQVDSVIREEEEMKKTDPLSEEDKKTISDPEFQAEVAKIKGAYIPRVAEGAFGLDDLVYQGSVNRDKVKEMGLDKELEDLKTGFRRLSYDCTPFKKSFQGSSEIVLNTPETKAFIERYNLLSRRAEEIRKKYNEAESGTQAQANT